MIADTVMGNDFTENRNDCNSRLTNCVIYAGGPLADTFSVLTTRELLARLEAGGIKNHQIAKVLGVSPSRVTEMRKGERAIKLDEAAKLVAAFQLDGPQPSPRVSPIPAQIARLVVLYIATELGVADTNQHQVEVLAEDVRAFAEFATDPAVRESIDAAELFFQAMRLRRPAPEAAAPQETDPQSTS